MRPPEPETGLGRRTAATPSAAACASSLSAPEGDGRGALDGVVDADDTCPARPVPTDHDGRDAISPRSFQSMWRYFEDDDPLDVEPWLFRNAAGVRPGGWQLRVLAAKSRHRWMLAGQHLALAWTRPFLLWPILAIAATCPPELDQAQPAMATWPSSSWSRHPDQRWRTCWPSRRYGRSDRGGDLQRRAAAGQVSALGDLGGFDGPSPTKPGLAAEVQHVGAPPPVGAGDCWSRRHDSRIPTQEADPPGLSAPRAPWSEVPLDQALVTGEILFAKRTDLHRMELGLEPFEVDLPIAGESNCNWFDTTVGMAQLDDDVLQGVGRCPLAISVAQIIATVEEIDERLNGGRVGGVRHERGGGAESNGIGGGTATWTASVLAA